MRATKRVNQAQEVEAALHRRIQVLRNTDGRLPSEADLATEFGVSRVTVREALSSLEQRGLVLRRHGLGTFVNRTATDLPLRLEESVEFGELIRAAGYESGLRLAEWQIGEAPADIASQLLIEEREPVLNIRKVFTASGTPVIHCMNVVPLGLLSLERRAELIKKIDAEVPVYSLLARWFGQSVAYQLSEVGACVADPDIAAMLVTEVRAPLLSIQEVGYSEEQRPLFYALVHYVPDLIHFRLIRKPIYAVEDLP